MKELQVFIHLCHLSGFSEDTLCIKELGELLILSNSQSQLPKDCIIALYGQICWNHDLFKAANCLTQQATTFLYPKWKKTCLKGTIHLEPYIYDVHTDGVSQGGVLNFLTCLRILLFVNKRSIAHFFGWWSQNWFFCGRHKSMTP